MDLILSPERVRQPEVYVPEPKELHVAIASLSLGGAERIVLDWAERIYPRYRVHLIVLRDRAQEWDVPEYVRVTRLGGSNLVRQLEEVGKVLSGDKNPVCVCHLLSTRERRALASAGVFVVPVFHNAKEGWTEKVSLVGDAPYAIAVSQACADDLREEGWRGAISVIRHIPRLRTHDLDIRAEARRAWNIPQDAIIIGMIGAIKPQKNYSLALRVLKRFHERMETYLVILGGPVNTSVGREAWNDVVSQVEELGIRKHVAMPGFVPDAARFLPVFDCLLNTSHFEGLSMATLEALLAGIPVVASEVGGQGEIGDDRLTLIPPDSSEDVWGDALYDALVQGRVAKPPVWADFPSFRLWTLAGIARPVRSSAKTLFVTANLSSGGAQRSLVNLTKGLHGRLEFEIMVAGRSSFAYFFDELTRAGVRVWNAGARWNAFDYVESIAEKVVTEGFGTICFWNVDPRIKLLLTKMFAFSGLRLIDVSPGGHADEEMDTSNEFQSLIAFDRAQFIERVDAFVHKYQADPSPGSKDKSVVIRNGVLVNDRYKTDYAISGKPRIIVSGRIAPSKFLIEIVEAMRVLWTSVPETELHIMGAVERYHQDYYDDLVGSIGNEVDKRIFFHGSTPDVTDQLPDFDAYVVLGQHQGCPNALLEALAAGLPVVGNDDGGTREQIIDSVTGLLIAKPDPLLVAQALARIITDRCLAKRLGEAGREHVTRMFSMETMVDAYEALFLEGGSAEALPLQMTG